MSVKYVRVEEDQSVKDLAIQEYGSILGQEALYQDNPDVINFYSDPEPGTMIKIDSDKILNKDIVSLLKEKGIKPANSSGLPEIGGFSSGFSNGFNI